MIDFFLKFLLKILKFYYFLKSSKHKSKLARKSQQDGLALLNNCNTNSTIPANQIENTIESNGIKHSKNGTPRVASLFMDNAPVHIDVGGCIYTSSLETLTK
jgi:hypothetical protein